jgi:hypothetical protein
VVVAMFFCIYGGVDGCGGDGCGGDDDLLQGQNVDYVM